MPSRSRTRSTTSPTPLASKPRSGAITFASRHRLARIDAVRLAVGLVVDGELARLVVGDEEVADPREMLRPRRFERIQNLALHALGGVLQRYGTQGEKLHPDTFMRAVEVEKRRAMLCVAAQKELDRLRRLDACGMRLGERGLGQHQENAGLG